MEIEIISRECIKPSSPTPHHLRTYKISLVDQFGAPTLVSSILFYPPIQASSLSMSKRSQVLKLSSTLTLYYPIVGRFINNLSIDCNDEGLCYTVARLNCGLHDYLNGFAIGIVTPHHIFDATSSIVFLKTWATMRFVFEGAVVSNLKSKAVSSGMRNPTCVEVVLAFLFRCVMSALKAKYIWGLEVNFDVYCGQVREVVSTINGDFVKSLQGARGLQRFLEFEAETRESYYKALPDGAEFIVFNSWCNARRMSNGIEEWVALEEEIMYAIEHDEELLSLASVNPISLKLFVFIDFKYVIKRNILPVHALIN
ncbi:tabersonine-19-hydroxy-O-acetyltransferase-like [Tripterygium wilfordii]|uniref:tabersonine-19-hydroxy-O-acetyltransferase-like n=1 Tax=Tripterygium wilfordii TaxID=458696 RepID=UPI0018F82CBA|nr:tabersonine-19-hydroxy-O-acetyltransferase-like [Tripterygium wilfordii]